jgi:hypothetical protein
MRAITVRQPWAWAIVHGGKDVENRTRNIAGSYRGPVAIHAGLRLDEDYDRVLIGRAVGELARAQAGGPGLRSVAQRAGEPLTPGNAITERYGNLGAVIGVVDLVGAHHADRNALECAHLGGRHQWCSLWAEPGIHHLVLANPRPLARPIPWRGALGLWRVPDELEAAIREQVTL